MISSQLNRWLWKWHVIAGLLSLPFVILLTITGTIYLFKADLNNIIYEDIKFVEVPETSKALSLSLQKKAVTVYTQQPIIKLFLSLGSNEATGFQIKSHDRTVHIVYVNPYTAKVTGDIKQTDTLMYTIRKLHGELLLNKPGTLLVELVASWFVVLLITGLVIWFPLKKTSLGGFFTIRLKSSKRLMWRDIHAVFSFWVSIILLIIIAGAMPWTDVFGSQLKWVQKQTSSGYPILWRKNTTLESSMFGSKLSLDDMMKIANKQQLLGQITMTLPLSDQGVFSVSNRSFWLSDQQVLHIDQYTGAIIKKLTWQDVGFLMDVRQVFMRLHQGEYGRPNWWILLGTCLLFFTASVGGVMSYLTRRLSGQLGLPQVPETFKVGYIVLFIIGGLGVVFPLFGLSVVLIILIQATLAFKQYRQHKSA
jgi:uncharacterized iron-regulated membrane protein